MLKHGKKAVRFTVADGFKAFLNSPDWKDSALPRRAAFWVAEIGTHNVATLTPETIDATLGKLLRRGKLNFRGEKVGERISAGTFNRYRACLASLYKWLHAQRLIPVSVLNPVRATKAQRENAGRIRFLSREEFDALMAAARVCHYYRMELFIRVAVASGLRLSNLQNIRWRDIDKRAGTITVAGLTKAQRQHVVALPDDLHADVEKLRPAHNPDHFLFRSEKSGERRASFVKSWRACLRMAKLDRQGVCIHTLRHTCASWMAQKGVPLLTIAAALDHSNLNITKRYAHLSVTERRDAARAVFGGI